MQLRSSGGNGAFFALSPARGEVGKGAPGLWLQGLECEALVQGDHGRGEEGRAACGKPR